MHYIVSINQPSVTSNNNTPTTTTINSPGIHNPDSSSLKTAQRRKKGPGHRRTNSKGSVTSWTPPSLSAIADQEQKRASTYIPPNVTEKTFPTNQTVNSPPPTISANVDSKSIITNRQLNPKTLKLDLQNSTDSQITPSNHPRPATIFTYALRKSSSSDPEEIDDNRHSNLSRQRRRRTFISANTKISSPSSVTVRSIKSTPNTPQLEELESENRNIDESNETEKANDLRRHPQSVSFHLSPVITNERSPSYPQRKNFNRVK